MGASPWSFWPLMSQTCQGPQTDKKCWAGPAMGGPLQLCSKGHAETPVLVPWLSPGKAFQPQGGWLEHAPMTTVQAGK